MKEGGGFFRKLFFNSKEKKITITETLENNKDVLQLSFDNDMLSMEDLDTYILTKKPLNDVEEYDFKICIGKRGNNLILKF
jgi:hypothetical protein